MAGKGTLVIFTLLATAATLLNADFGQTPGAQAALDAHNNYRSRHNALPLAWHSGLAKEAAVFAGQCDFNHEPNNDYQGENLYVTTNFDLGGEMAAATKMWYDEVQMYDFKNATFSEETGHFTQLVWKKSLLMGCAARVCPDHINSFRAKRGTLVVCRYFPAGNVMGKFRENVEGLGV